MKSVVICNEAVVDTYNFETFELLGKNIGAGIVETADPEFIPNSQRDYNRVLIQKIAFSCNFRDKALMLHLFDRISKRSKENLHKGFYSFIGSEFIGIVIDKGNKVTTLSIGDVVIPDGSYPYRLSSGSNPGLPTNKASAYYEIFDEHQLLAVSKDLPHEIGAGITIGAQTVYSMLRRLNIQEGSNVLVTSCCSNTSLFAVEALLNRNINLYCLSTSEKAYLLKGQGIKDIVVGSISNPEVQAKLRTTCSSSEGFDYIIDPFVDLHINHLIDLMSYNSTYIFCGINSQHSLLNSPLLTDIGALLFPKLIFKNISLIGNCLGTKEDLSVALDDFHSGKFRLKIDSIFNEDDVKGFFERSFKDQNRLGKVIFRY